MTQTHTIFAPAKINLYLHITGRLENGYHTLDSLIGFADIGDEIHIEPADAFIFEIDGPFAGSLNGSDLDTGIGASNLVVRAVNELCGLTGQSPDIKVTLTKNLPLGAGLGGGSTDAASIIWQLLEYWELPKDYDGLYELMLSLGADVPVCFKAHSARVQGIGEILEPAPMPPEIPIVLVHPGKPCHTAKIFALSDAAHKETVILPEQLDTLEELTAFLAKTQNDLTPAACQIVPEIENVLNALSTQAGCAIARMSGSGSACFGLFETLPQAESAAQNISQDNPDWWVQSGWLGRPERY